MEFEVAGHRWIEKLPHNKKMQLRLDKDRNMIILRNNISESNDNFIIKLMNDYLTPRRRHSSLFQRM